MVNHSKKELSTVFLHGISQRSGTNFLNQLLLLHPQVLQPVSNVRENWFLDASDPLWAYKDALLEIWGNPDWQGMDVSSDVLVSKIGEALSKFLAHGVDDDEASILLSKTPSVRHLVRCSTLFPNNKFLIIVRNPADVASSAFHAWGRPVKNTLREWDRACLDIEHFESQCASISYLLVRYEDLVTNTRKVLYECLDFLKLDTDQFDWESCEALPIFGSSDNDNWKITQNVDNSFVPIGKWRNLPTAERETIERCIPSCSALFGYNIVHGGDFSPLPDAMSRRELSSRVTEVGENLESPRASRKELLRRAVRNAWLALRGPS